MTGRGCLLLGVCFLISMPLFSQGAYLELNLSGGASRGFFAGRAVSYLGFLAAIDRAAGDDNIKGIVLNVSGYHGSRENLWELRRALSRFRSGGKRVVAFINFADLDLYALATVADKIVMDGQGSLRLSGYAWGRPYVFRALERLGIGVRELRYFEYKSGMETFTRDSLSEADSRQYGDFLDDIFAYTRGVLMEARAWTEEEFYGIVNGRFLFSAPAALEAGLVDRLGRREAVMEAISELEGGEVKTVVVFGGEPEAGLMQARAAYRAQARPSLLRRPPAVAVVYASGATDMDRGMEARLLARTIRELSQRRRVKAIVLRINSPGGSAEAADYLAEAVRLARKSKPVVVSMGGAAASGGYWAAVHASHIAATPHTLTGSIGVIGSWFFDAGMSDRLGISVGLMQRGDSADLLAGFILPHRDLREDEQELFQSYVMDLYRGFIAVVAEGRGKTPEEVEAVAEGRVFSGQRALEAGLVDSIGGLWDAVYIARDLAGIPPGKRIILSEYPRPSFRDRLVSRLAMFAAGVLGAGPSGISAAWQPAGMAGEHLDDLFFRMQRNGQALPILPLGLAP